MKNILLFLCLLLINTTSYATANFTSATGVFLVPNVSVNGITNYESVTLQLDLSNGTFSVLDATLKDTSFSETPIETLSSNGLKVDFYGCARTGHNQVTCRTKVMSINSDDQITIPAAHWNSNMHTAAFDNFGREYSSKVTAFDQSSTYALVFTLIQGVPATVDFIFDNIDIKATSFTAFQPAFSLNSPVQGNFRNILF